MLNSPIKVSSSNRCTYDTSVHATNTEQVILPATDSVLKVLHFVAGDVDADNEFIEFASPHGVETYSPVSLQGADLPAGWAPNRTFSAIALTPTRLQFAARAGGSATACSDQGSGTDLLVQVRRYAQRVLLSNYGGYDIVFRARPLGDYTISDTDIEALLSFAAAQPYILNVIGNRVLACRSIGTASKLCIIPLEND